MGKASQMEVCVSEKGYEQLLASGKMPEDCMLRRGQSEAKMPKPCSHGIRGSFQTCGSHTQPVWTVDRVVSAQKSIIRFWAQTWPPTHNAQFKAKSSLHL